MPPPFLLQRATSPPTYTGIELSREPLPIGVIDAGPEALRPFSRTDCENIIGHLVEAGVHHFVVHAEYENVMEELRHQLLQVGCRFAVDMPQLRLCRSVRLALQRRASDKGGTVQAERRERILQEQPLLRWLNVLQHVERVYRVKITRDGAIEHVMHMHIELPPRHHSLLHVFDEYRIEVDSRELSDLGLNDTRAECVSASHLQHMVAACQHLRDELVARPPKDDVLRILVPALAAAKPQRLISPFIGGLDADLILRFLGLQCFHDGMPFYGL